MVHAGRTVTVESADHTLRVYDGEELLSEVPRTTSKPIARFKVGKPEPARRAQQRPMWKREAVPVPEPPPEAIAAANSPDWSTRTRAGQQLAAWADRNEIAAILQRLLLDDADTAVTEETCLALLRRNDIHGIRLVARAIVTAADTEYIQHIYDAVSRYLQPDGPLRDFLHLCTALTQDHDVNTAFGAAELVQWALPWAATSKPE